MQARILEIEKNTWIQTYHIRNFELGLLQNNVPWILGQYINCFYHSKAKARFNHCMPEKRYFEKKNVMSVQKFRFNKDFLSLGVLDFVQWVKELINCGWYIMGYFDEYYIREKASYHRRHFRHSMLIYGYDDETQLFNAMGYTKDRKYSSHFLTYDELVSSINVDFDREKEAYVKDGIDKIEFDAFRVNPDFEFTFDLKQVYTSLLDYINSEDSGYKNQRGLKYGLECEEEFVNYIRAQRGNSLDERYSRFFVELKELMLQRLNYLTSRQIVTRALFRDYEIICEQQRIIHMLFIKHNLIRTESIIDRLTERMNSIIDSEKIVLRKIIDEIYAYLVRNNNEEYL